MPISDPEKRRVYYRKRYAENGDAVRARQNAWIKRNYSRRRYLDGRKKMSGLSMELVENGINGVCEICGIRPMGQGHGKREVLAIDHDHVSGAFRGFLCIKCNRGLGLFCDDPEKLLAAVKYLAAKRKG